MPETFAAVPNRTTQDGRLLWLLLFLPVIMALSGVWILDHGKANKPLFSMTNLVGRTTQSLLAGEGLTACTEEMGTRGNPICFHAARMPMSALVVGLGIRLFGDHYLRVACFKTLLFLLPVGLCVYLVWRSLPRFAGSRLLVQFPRRCGGAFVLRSTGAAGDGWVESSGRVCGCGGWNLSLKEWRVAG